MLKLNFLNTVATPPRRGRIASHPILSTITTTYLAPYLTEDGGVPFSLPAEPLKFVSTAALLFDDDILMAGRLRRLRLAQDVNGDLLLAMPDFGRITVQPNGSILIDTHLSPESRLCAEMVLGPALILALAQRQTYCLHASAVATSNGTILFLGHSGRGKSTAAHHLSRQCGWHLTADDVLACRLTANHVDAHPHYPQLKLDPAQQHTLTAPPILPISRVYLLVDSTAETVTASKVTASQAAIMLVSHTVAARLFSAALLTQHLEFTAKMGERVPLTVVQYPHGGGSLEALQKLVVQHEDE